jgi:hypothetical protein
MTEILPNPEQPLSHDVYLTEESIALAALIDAMDRRVFNKWKEEEK